MYKGCKAKVKTKKDIGVEIEILRGVKQGVPLSPLLFNLCLEPLLDEMEKNGTADVNVNEGNKIPVLAFVDDIVLLGEDEREAQCQMDELHKYMESLDMNISVEETQAFQVVVKKDTWFIMDSEIKIKNTRIPAIDPDIAFRYLGAKIGLWKGIYYGIVVSKILSKERRVTSVKPCQKIKLLTNYIFYRFIYNLLINLPSDGVLKLMDSEVR